MRPDKMDTNTAVDLHLREDLTIDLLLVLDPEYDELLAMNLIWKSERELNMKPIWNFDYWLNLDPTMNLDIKKKPITRDQRFI